MLSTFQFADHVVGIIVNSDVTEEVIKSINRRNMYENERVAKIGNTISGRAQGIKRSIWETSAALS